MDVVRGERSTTVSPDSVLNRRIRQQDQKQHPKNRGIKMFNKVQVVYYLTRHGHLEHPHYIEVSHLATQPLRLRDVMERLTVLRGKVMPARYSWSCKRNYKHGFVWNDLTENDAIYATDGSEYILKGSELIQDEAFSELAESRVEELQTKVIQPKKDSNTKFETNGLITSKAHPRQSYRQVATDHVERPAEHTYDLNGSNNVYEEEEDEEEKRVSCNSSNAIYSKPVTNDCHLMMQMEQDESYSLPSTSSTSSDKQVSVPPLVKTTTSSVSEIRPISTSDSKRFDKDLIVEEDGDPLPPLSRNAVLLQLIACGGGGYVGKAKVKAKKNSSMRNTFIPCLKQQLSSRGMNMISNPLHKEVGSVGEQQSCNCKVVDSSDQQGTIEADDEDLVMVKYMSENPRFGNLQSQEKEYFSGTIVEAMTHHHTQSFGSDSSRAQLEGRAHSNLNYSPALTKSSSYNERRNANVGLQAAACNELEEEEKDDLKVAGIIKLCLPRKKSCSVASNKSNKS